jgi:hypothetical protein
VETCLYEAERKFADDLLGEFPDVWRRHFCEMTRAWATCARHLELASALFARYAGEPLTSRDHFERPQQHPVMST